MRKVMYSMYDKKLKVHLTPFLTYDDDKAVILECSRAARDGEFRHCQDYQLCKLAVFDEQAGTYSTDCDGVVLPLVVCSFDAEGGAV